MGVSLEMIDVTKRIGGRALLDTASMRVAAGEISVIVGPSGCGKSTTLRLFNRLYEADSGTILVNGKSITEIDPIELRRTVGFIPQIPAMFEGTVGDNLRFGRNLLTGMPGQPPPPDTEKETLMLAGLSPDFLDRTASKLSVGEQQRVAIARALMLYPEILLMDEPTSALDPHSVGKVERAVSGINRTVGTTFVVVTHDPDQAMRLGQRIFWLNGGSLREIDKNEVEDLMKGKNGCE